MTTSSPRSAVDRRADLVRLVRTLRREAIDAGADARAVRTWPLEQLLAHQRRQQLTRLTHELRRQLVHLGVPFDEANGMRLEELIAARKRILADLIERPGRGAGCQS